MAARSPARRAPRFLLPVAVAAAVLLAACSGGAESKLKTGRAAFEAGRTEEAAVALRGALADQQRLPEARLLLARLWQREGLPQAALSELEKAREVGADENVVVPWIARLMVETGEGKKALSTFGSTQLPDAAANRALKAALVRAQAAGGQMDAARAALEALAAQAPNDPVVQQTQARMAASAGRTDEAVAWLDKALATASTPEAWMLKGQILDAKRPGDAAAAYAKAVELDPHALAPHVALVSALRAAGRHDEAKRATEPLAKGWPRNVQTVFIQAHQAMIDGDPRGADERFAAVLAKFPDDPRALLLAASNDLTLGKPASAETRAGRVVQAVPDSAAARRLLAAAYLAQGSAVKARDTMKPVFDAGKPEPEDLYVQSMIAGQMGDTARADALLREAAQARPDDVEIQTSMAMQQMSRGDAQAGVEALQAIARKAQLPAVDMALVSFHVRRGDFAAASAAIDQIEKHQPKSPLAADLRGQLRLVQRDLAGARKAFEESLARDAAYYPAAARLSQMDLGEGKAEQAMGRLLAFVKANPRSVDATLALAALRYQHASGDAAVETLLTEGIRANPRQAQLRVALVDLNIARRLYRPALSAAQEAAAALPNDPDVLDALGRAQGLAGEYEQAAASFGRLQNMQPNAPRVHLRMASLRATQGNAPEAVAALRRALDLSRTRQQQEQVIAAALQMRQTDVALAATKVAQKDNPDRGFGYALEGEVLANAGKPAQARAAFEQARSRAPDDAGIVARIHAMLLAENRAADAQKLVDEWTAGHAKDIELLMRAAGNQVARQHCDAAEPLLRRALERSPGLPDAANNLAWCLLEQKKPGALALAQQAVAAAPDRAAMLDTLASAQAAEGQLDAAIKTQREAIARAPAGLGPMHVRLVELLIAKGDRSAAREELKRLKGVGEQSPLAKDVARLSARLGG